jgi:signal transduction histidine kinase
VIVDLDAQEPPESTPSEIEVALYRIFQEALTNVARHAEAHRVQAWIRREGAEMVLVVEDDGRGFDAGRLAKSGDGRAGLTGMRERVLGLGGKLDVKTAPGRGVRLEARMPLEATHDG